MTSLKSELHQMKRDLERRIFDVEMRLLVAAVRLLGVCTVTMILFVGAQKLLR